MTKLQASETEVKKFLGGIPQDISDCEKLPNLLATHGGELSNFFSTIINHRTIPYQKNLLAIYTYTICPSSDTVVDVFLTKEDLGMSMEELKRYALTSSIFDFNCETGPLLVTEKVVQIVQLWLNGHPEKDPIFLGYLFPEDNSLVCCDFTHVEQGINFFWKLFKYLSNYGLLLPVLKEKNKKKKEKIIIPNITFGADPEFEVLSETGNVISLRSEECPYDGIETEKNSLGDACYTAPVGADHSGHQVEFRPESANSPTEIVANMRNLFRRVSSEARFSAIGNYYAIGGHIHIGIGTCIRPSVTLLKLLDYFVGKPTLKMSGEARGHYSCLSAYEIKSYGFEYRTPPAGLFAHPKMTYVTFKLVKSIILHYLNRKEFVLGDNVSIEELIKYGRLTERQAKYYLDFINSFKENNNYHVNMAVAWNRQAKKIKKVRTSASNVVFRVSFGDEWENNYVIDSILRAINSLNIRTRNPRYLERPIRIRLYGLSYDRGDVIAGNITLSGFNNISHPNSSSTPFFYGIPYVIRMGDVSSDTVRELVRSITTNITNIIQGRL